MKRGINRRSTGNIFYKILSSLSYEKVWTSSNEVWKVLCRITSKKSIFKSEKTKYRNFENNTLIGELCFIEFIFLEKLQFFDKNAIFEKYFLIWTYAQHFFTKSCSKNICEKSKNIREISCMMHMHMRKAAWSLKNSSKAYVR